MSKKLIIAPVLALLIAACSRDPVTSEQNPPAADSVATVDGDGADGTISVFPERVHQTIDGFGTSMRLFDDPHLNGKPPDASTGGIVMTTAQRDTIYDLLYDAEKGIGLNRLRVAVSEPGWQVSLGAPIVVDAAYPGPQGTAIADFMTQAKKRNPGLQIGFQIGRFDAWVTGRTPAPVVAEYIKTGVDFIRSKGHPPDWVGVVNEPSYSPTNFSGENLRDILVALRTLLEKDGGYRATASFPDDVNDALGAPKTATVLADPVARSFVGSLSIHLYGDSGPYRMAALAKQYGLPLWMTEYNAGAGTPNTGWASAIVHEMLVSYDCSAVDMLFGFVGSPSPSSAEVAYIRLNSQGTAYRGYTLNKSYFQMGHWSRYVTRGSVRIEATSTNAALKVSAFTAAGKKVIVVINTSTHDRTQSIAIPEGHYRVIRTQLAGSDRLSDKGVFKGAVRLPAESITTLIQL